MTGAPEPPALERLFLGWDASALDQAAGQLIEHYADPTADRAEARLDRAIVVLPGARAGRRLTELLLEHAERRDVRLVPPRMTSVGILPEFLYEPKAPLAEPALTRRVWAHTLRSLEHERITSLFPYPPEPDDLTGWSTLARIVERLHRDVSGAGLRFADVVERCADGLLHDDGARWRVLAELRDVYLDRLRELGYADRHEARIAAVEANAVTTDHDIWLVGVVELPAITRRILAALAGVRARPGGAPEKTPVATVAPGTQGAPDRGTIRALVHAPASRAADFDPFGCVRPEAWRDAILPIDEAQLTVADRPAGQATTVLDALAALDGELAADEVTIGVPDDEVVPYLEQNLAAAGATARYASGTPVTRTGPYRLLTAIADYLDGRRFDSLATLLRHPDLTRWLARRAEDPAAMEVAPTDVVAPTTSLSADAPSVADYYFRDALPARVGGGLAAGTQHHATLAAMIAALDEALLGTLDGSRRLAEWAPAILGVLVEVYGERPLDALIPAERMILEASECIGSAAAALHRLPEEVDEPCSAVQAIRLLLAEIESESLAPDAEDIAVELLGWLELHLDDAPALIITGLNEPYAPESVTVDSFLPNTLRSRLGLVDNEFRYARDAYQLTAILHSRPHVHLITGRTTALGDPLHPSRLLLAAAPETIAKRVLRFYADDEAMGQAPAATADHSRASTAASEPGFSLPPEPVLVLPEPPTRLSVTDFGAALRDPYRFVLERLYRLQPLDDAAAELDGLVFGSLTHHVLGEFGVSELADETDEGRLSTWLDERLDHAARDWFGAHPLPTVRVQIEQLRARLRAFAGWQARRAAEGWRIAATEVSPPGDGLEFDVDGEPVLVRGRIDRIDHHPELDAWTVYDYKSSDKGDPPERTHRTGRSNAKQWVDLQLPLYRHLAAALEAPGGGPLIPRSALDRLDLGYVLLPRDLGATGEALAEWTAEELGEADEAARDVVRMLREGRIEFDPETTRSYPNDPLASLLGLSQLAAAASNDGDDGGAA